MPPVISALLLAIRDNLKRAGDDGTSATTRARMQVLAGWPEVRAIYQMWAGARKVVAERNTMKRALRASDRDLARHRADIDDHDLIRDKAVLRVLEECWCLAAGEIEHEGEIRALQKKLAAVLARAKTADRFKQRRP